MSSFDSFSNFKIKEEYSNDNVTSEVAYAGSTLSVASVFAKKGVNAGFSAAYDVSKGALTGYTLAGNYSDSGLTFFGSV